MTVCIVDSVAVSDGIDNGQPQFHAALLNLHRTGLQIDSAARLLLDASLGLLKANVGEEEAVDERRLAEAALSCTVFPFFLSKGKFSERKTLTDHHQIEFKALFHRLSMHLIGQICEAVCKKNTKINFWCIFFAL